MLAPKPQRRCNKTQSSLADAVCYPWRTRMKRTPNRAFTTDEKTLRALKRKERKVMTGELLDKALDDVWKIAEDIHTSLGTNTIKYWYTHILQRGGMKLNERRTSRWNAFVRKEVKSRNDALPSDAPRPKIHAYMPEIRAAWNVMSAEERIAATEDALAELVEMKKMKRHASHHIRLHAFHDVRANVKRVHKQLETLHNRTGIESLLVLVRSESADHSYPSIWASSDLVAECFQSTCKLSITEFASKIESHSLFGKDGALNDYYGDLLQLKHATAALIVQKLIDITGSKLRRMFYNDFESHITEKAAIVIDNWPLTSFASPSTVNSRLELQALYDAWESGATRFRRLSEEEFVQWKESRDQAAFAALVLNDPPSAPASVTFDAINEDNDGITLFPDNSILVSSGAIDPALLHAPSPDIVHIGRHDLILSDPTYTPAPDTPLVLPAVEAEGDFAHGPFPNNIQANEELRQPQNNLSSATTTLMHQPKKVRKERSDKGKARGPYRKGKGKLFDAPLAKVTNIDM